MVRVGRTVVPVFVVRDGTGRAVATVRVLHALLTLNFLDELGHASGKRAVFKGLEDSGALDVHAWNCPNPRFLSCVGAHLQTMSDSEVEVAGAEASVLGVVELGKKLGHYLARCTGLFETPGDSIIPIASEPR